jgi:hypothetical protein
MLKTILVRLAPALAVGSIFLTSARAQSVLYTLNADKDYDRLGVSVHSAGDVNHDGHPDFIAGAPENGFIFGLGEGYARVYNGLTGATLYTLNGANSGDAFGTAVAGCGDVNGDGYADFVVGAPGAGVSASQAGRVTVFSGKTGAVLWTFDGDAAGDQLGMAVAGAGDVDNDGYADIIVGAPLAASGGQNRGYARIYSGKTGAILRTFVGVNDGDRLGASVDGAGDINHDGKADVIVGSYLAGAKVYSGANGAVLWSFTAPADDRLGYAVAGAGDVNGDGTPDVIVGAPQDGNVFLPGAGYAVVYSGLDGSTLLTLNGVGSGDRFGCGVGGAKDVNGDNHADLIVGADQYPISGAGYVQVLSGSTGAVLYAVPGSSSTARIGTAVDGLGDVNGNGQKEFAIGSPGDSSAFNIGGQVKVWSANGASCPPPSNYCSSSVNSTGASAAIGNSGSTSLSANNFVLTASGCPANKLGLFVYGQNQGQTPLGNGTLCVGSPFFRMSQTTTSASGAVSFPVNFGALPTNGHISAGQTWNFTFWFRDPAAGGGNSNLSNGRQVTFCP